MLMDVQSNRTRVHLYCTHSISGKNCIIYKDINYYNFGRFVGKGKVWRTDPNKTGGPQSRNSVYAEFFCGCVILCYKGNN